MLKNVYSPLSGGVLQERLMEIISNNLANTNTTAFKEDEISFRIYGKFKPSAIIGSTTHVGPNGIVDIRERFFRFGIYYSSF